MGASATWSNGVISCAECCENEDLPWLNWKLVGGACVNCYELKDTGDFYKVWTNRTRRAKVGTNSQVTSVRSAPSSLDKGVREASFHLGQLVHKSQRVTVINRPSVHRVRVSAVLGPNQPQVFVIASIVCRHLLLLRTFRVVMWVRVQPGPMV